VIRVARGGTFDDTPWLRPTPTSGPAASNLLPGVFTPVMIDVEADGQHYQEMHVDSGAVAQTF
jgi:hypothetical protein